MAHKRRERNNLFVFRRYRRRDRFTNSRPFLFFFLNSNRGIRVRIVLFVRAIHLAYVYALPVFQKKKKQNRIKKRERNFEIILSIRSCFNFCILLSNAADWITRNE